MSAPRVHFKRPHPENLIGWGSSEWYFEVRDGGIVARQLEVYANGRILAYDETRAEDEHGGLADQPLDLADFAPFRISEREFAEAWERAQTALLGLGGWSFRVEEVSAGVYCATGVGPRGMRVESTDTDPAKALADCHAFAQCYPS